jgi:N-acetylglucosamine kinase-like BadF-type ATPase
MSRLIIGVDAGGTKTAVVVARDGEVVARNTGPGAKMRSGRGITCAATIAEVARRALAQAGATRADLLIAGVAGAGREAEREELRQAFRAETLA